MMHLYSLTRRRKQWQRISLPTIKEDLPPWTKINNVESPKKEENPLTAAVEEVALLLNPIENKTEAHSFRQGRMKCTRQADAKAPPVLG